MARGVPGEGPDCHSPKEILGFGPIPARILKFLIFILALSTARVGGPTLKVSGRRDPGLKEPALPVDSTIVPYVTQYCFRAGNQVSGPLRPY